MMALVAALLVISSAAAQAPTQAGDVNARVARCVSLGFTDLPAAIKECSRVIDQAQTLGDRELEATGFAFRAAAESWGNDWEGAIRDAELALSLIDRHSDSLASRQASLVLGAVHRERGDAGPALMYNAEAIEKSRRAGDALMGSLAHSTMARTLFWLGDFAQARKEADTAAELARSVKSPFHEFYAVWQRGMTEFASGHLDDAQQYLENALHLAESIQFSPGVVMMQINLATLNIERRDLDAVKAALDGVRRMIKNGQAPPLWVTYVDDAEGALLAAQGQHTTAADRFARAAGANPSPWLRLHALVGRARALRDSGLADQAIAAYRDAITAVENVRADTPADAQRATYMAENLIAFRERVSLLWKQHGSADAAAAFEIAEAARARALRDALAAAGQAPGLAQPVTAAAVQSHLAPGQVFVEYMQSGPQLFVFIASPSRLSWMTLPAADTGALASRVGFFRQLVQQESTMRALVPAARQLFDDLIAPVLRAAGSDATTLIISPDGVLQFLPFELLAPPDDRGAGALLVERYVVQYSPSAALLLNPRAASGNRRILAVSDPKAAPFNDARTRSTMRGDTLHPLVYSSAEADHAFRSAGGRGTLLKGELAKESAVKTAALNGFGILHFATHAVINHALPQRSALLLGSGDGEDGLLEAGEIYGLSLNANLVVLSACQTGIGQLVGGEGPQSLGRAFLRAGAERVVSTLWPIDDQQTVALMSSFYRALADGVQPAAALTMAKRASIASGVPPRVWAAFVLNGRLDARTEAGGSDSIRWVSMLPALVAVLTIAFVIGWRRTRRGEGPGAR